MLELLKRKNNIFDHVLYEFWMYHESYNILQKLFVKDDYDSLVLRNASIESHAVHLRNLIEFFSCENGCISIKTIFNEYQDLALPMLPKCYKQSINKAIDHLTEERYKWNQDERNLTMQLSNTITKMHDEYIPYGILKCVDLLLQEESVKQLFIQDLRDNDIQNRLLQLKGY